MREEQSEPPVEEPVGVSMADVLALPDELQMIVAWLMRQGEAGLPETAAMIQQDEAIANTLLSDLAAKGFVQEVPSEGEGQPLYQVRLASKRTRKLSLDL